MSSLCPCNQDLNKKFQNRKDHVNLEELIVEKSLERQKSFENIVEMHTTYLDFLNQLTEKGVQDAQKMPQELIVNMTKEYQNNLPQYKKKLFENDNNLKHTKGDLYNAQKDNIFTLTTMQNLRRDHESLEKKYKNLQCESKQMINRLWHAQEELKEKKPDVGLGSSKCALVQCRYRLNDPLKLSNIDDR